MAENFNGLLTPPTPASMSESEPRSGGVLGLVKHWKHLWQ
jgi:hypothetical protein